MSRIGKQPISIPESTTVTINGGMICVKGPKGSLEHSFPAQVQFQLHGRELLVSPQDSKQIFDRAMWGTARAIIANMIRGVNEGFSKTLEIQGVGYKVTAKGKNLLMDVGYSHPVEFPIPDGIEAKCEGLIITVNGMDKELVGQVAAEIRKIRKPEPYKGKGIRYSGEHVRRKAGKVVKGSE